MKFQFPFVYGTHETIGSFLHDELARRKCFS